MLVKCGHVWSGMGGRNEEGEDGGKGDGIMAVEVAVVVVQFGGQCVRLGCFAVWVAAGL